MTKKVYDIIVNDLTLSTKLAARMRTVYSSNGTWIYVARVAEYYYYTTALVKTSTYKNVDLAGFRGRVVQPVRPAGYGPALFYTDKFALPKHHDKYWICI